MTVRQLADYTRLPFYSVHRALKVFEDTPIIQVRPVGRSHLITLNRDYFVTKDVLPALFSNRLEECLAAMVSATKRYAQSIYLFGSHARNDARPNSDVDLSFITVHKSKLNAALKKITAQLDPYYGTMISAYVHTPQEWKSNIKRKNSTELSILKEGRHLYGELLSSFQ